MPYTNRVPHLSGAWQMIGGRGGRIAAGVGINQAWMIARDGNIQVLDSWGWHWLIGMKLKASQ
jgi:hypothetical protein